MSAILDIHDMTVAYDRRPVLWNVDVTVNEPGLIAIVGPNGAGKSTLIKAALGLIPMVDGAVSVLGKPVNEQRRVVGYMPQRGSVDWDFPINVKQVVLTGTYAELGWFRHPGRKQKQRALECLEKVRLAEYSRRQIGELSGGQQQRVFLARALAQDAQLYFMDEPMAGVDAATERVIFDQLKALRDDGRTIIVVHHDLASVEENFDSVILLNMRVVAFGPVATTLTKENLHETYAGRLTVLDTVSAAVQHQQETR